MRAMTVFLNNHGICVNIPFTSIHLWRHQCAQRL